MKIAIHWFRRDLRIDDNTALYHALKSGLPVLPVFIFDDNILEELPPDDARVTFIHETLEGIDEILAAHGSGLKVLKGDPVSVWLGLIDRYEIGAVYTNKDYEPYAIDRDAGIRQLLTENNIEFHSYKDQVVFEEDEIVKNDGGPYTVYTPYSRKWLEKFSPDAIKSAPSESGLENLIPKKEKSTLSLEELGFVKSGIRVPDYDISSQLISGYDRNRDFPYREGTSLLGPYLRFGLVSVRRIIRQAGTENLVFLKELIWREFFMQVLYHFPHVVDRSFRKKYDNIEWQNNETKFKLWCEGQTGYPIVDAGMRELNATGFMHNRVRMVVAGFLCKHLLIDWRWGEAYFAGKLLDYELSSNNGNWQWAAGSGCDAAPYFRVFNPYTQQEKFDPEMKYIKKWVPEFETKDYPEPIVEHKTAREEAIRVYKRGLV